ncbi:hypothetical protein GCM10023219_31860 [Stakelama sediminis]|uniref:DUF3168 domain-containing protein n=1 Tax=Stakelama sediminis TaxID=463200 RepID=A0A840Z153_9SPHN|nr:DUF3168 domain-containing protein [Stakelama sediminis]MBB5719623.1 hypothetical protein [Stakelama sediminis]
MSAGAVVQAALVAALRADGDVTGAVTAVFDAPPVRSARPWLMVEEPVLTPWGTKDAEGWEARISMLAEDEGERPLRLRRLVETVGAAVEGVPGDLGEGWRLVTLAVLRSRIVRAGSQRWTAVIELRARMLRVD